MNGDRPRLPPGCRTVLACFAATCVFFTGFFPPGSNANELSRIEAIAAIAEHGTLAIDATLSEFGDHEDKAAANGHFYSNKAPGLVLAAVPAYLALRPVFGRPSRPTAPLFVAVRVATVSLVSLIALAVFARRLGRDGPEGAAALVLFALAFGTPFAFYARSFFSHAWTASLLFLAWDRIRAADEEPAAAMRRLVVAGLLAGAAAISEYPAVPIALLLALRAGSSRRARGVAAFAIGAALPGALLLFYDAEAFGSPFVFSFEREADPRFAGLAGVGFYGLRFPTWRAAWDALFHPARGAILFSPFWAFAAVGLVRWWRTADRRRDAAVAAGSIASVVLVAVCYLNWKGGWSLGVRYLLPALFFAGAALAPALASSRARALFLAAATFAAANFLLLASTYPHVPEDVGWPAANLAWPLRRGGFVAPNLATALGIPHSAAFGIAALLAVVALAAASGAVVPPGRRFAFLVAGAAAFAATLIRPPALSPQGRDEVRQVERKLARAADSPAARPGR